MKRTELRRSTPLRSSPSLLRGSGLNRVSAKRAKQNATYSKLRAAFLLERPRCEYPTGCQNAATDVHHRKGRVGALLLDTAHWSALCRPCHQFVTGEPALAY